MSIPTLEPTQRPVSVGTGFFLGSSGWGVKITTLLDLGPRLRMSGAIPLLPLYAFMTWTWKNFTFTIIIAGTGIAVRHVRLKTWESSYLCFANIVILEIWLFVERIIQS
jgi:hypothetical protein